MITAKKARDEANLNAKRLGWEAADAVLAWKCGRPSCPRHGRALFEHNIQMIERVARDSFELHYLQGYRERGFDLPKP